MKKYVFPSLITALLMSLPVVSADTMPVNLQVASAFSVIFEYSTVEFGTLQHDTSSNQATGSYSATIDANEDFELTVSGFDFMGSVENITIDHLKIDSDVAEVNLAVENATAFSETPTVIETPIDKSVTSHYHMYWVDVPENQAPDTYQASITLEYSVV